MSEVLYRKYRPQNFSDVVGQESIVKTLEAQVKNGTVSHAYLFAGSRGTGKTSIARILARELGTSDHDLYEIDAASKTSVDDIRELNESVNTLPFDSKYKVYILDEVHMLSKSAANAFLKTLEEPPEHVIFILATTETNRIPDTILSRCEVHTFQKPNIETLKKVVLNVAEKEGFKMSESSAELIALLGDGSFRDTLGTLQKVISATSKPSGKSSKLIDIADENVRVITGAPRGELVNGIIAGLGGDISNSLALVREASSQMTDISVLIKLVLVKMRAILLVRFGESAMVQHDMSAEDFAFIKKMADDKNFELSSQTLVTFLDAYTATPRATLPSLPLELALIEAIKK